MNGLAIFDVDGTLCRSSDLDDRCWSDAASEVLGLPEIETDWSRYDHSTDEAIATQLIRDRTDLRPIRLQVALVRDAFVRRVRDAIARDGGVSRPVPGAIELFDQLEASGWGVAIATGGWRVTANLKLETAGIRAEGVPAAHADDAHPRESIVTIARERAESRYGRTFDRLVYVGDGIWDVRASRSLGIGFLGIANGGRADELRDEGATQVLASFEPFSTLLGAIQVAETPGETGSR